MVQIFGLVTKLRKLSHEELVIFSVQLEWRSGWLELNVGFGTKISQMLQPTVARQVAKRGIILLKKGAGKPQFDRM